MEVEAQFVQGQFTACLVHLGQFVYTHHQGKVVGLLLYPADLLWSWNDTEEKAVRTKSESFIKISI